MIERLRFEWDTDKNNDDYAIVDDIVDCFIIDHTKKKCIDVSKIS